MTKTQIYVSLEPSIRDALQRLADADQRTLSQYCRVVLTRHVEEKEKE